MKLFIKIFISAAILIALIVKMDAQALSDAMHMIQASAWSYALVFIIAQLLLLSLRWMYLINIGRYRMNYGESLQITLMSLIANIAFIATIGGIVVRVAMACQYGASLFKSVFATGVDRIMTLAALLLMAAIFLPSLGQYVDGQFQKDLSLFISVMALTIFVFTPLLTLVVVKKLNNRSFSKGSMRSGLRYLTLLLNNQKLIGKILSVSLLAQLCFFVAVYFICLSAGVPLSFLQVMIVLPAIALVASLPFSFGGWGVREGAFIYGLGLLGVPMETAFSISVQVGILSLAGVLVAGLPVIILSKIQAAPNKKILSSLFVKK